MASVIVLNYLPELNEEWFDFDRLQIMNAENKIKYRPGLLKKI